MVQLLLLYRQRFLQPIGPEQRRAPLHTTTSCVLVIVCSKMIRYLKYLSEEQIASQSVI